MTIKRNIRTLSPQVKARKTLKALMAAYLQTSMDRNPEET